jgi:hypothetical protein
LPAIHIKDLRKVYGDAVFDQAVKDVIMAGELATSPSKRLMYATQKGREYLKGVDAGKKYVVFTSGTHIGSTVEVGAWEKEKQGYIQRQEEVPSVLYLPATEEHDFDIDFAQRLQGELQKEFANPAQTPKNFRIIRDLDESVREEKFAQKVYGERGGMAHVAGDHKTEELYKEIAVDEHQHETELTRRLNEVAPGKMNFVPDSAEYMSQTIQDSGWREKLDRAFQEAVERTHK